MDKKGEKTEVPDFLESEDGFDKFAESLLGEFMSKDILYEPL